MSRHKPKTPLHNWTNTGSFMNRPQNGWLHPKENLSPDIGVTYGVRYLGNIVVLESMKSLDFNTRTAIAKECIHRVASAAYPRAVFRKVKQPNCLFFTQRSSVSHFLADDPDLQFVEVEVNFTITVDSLQVVREDNGNLLYHHRMQTVSFASGGDGDLIDFIAYVAKDDNGRKCHVMECCSGLANDVITTIGQAFELRFKQHLQEKPSPIVIPDRLDPVMSNFEPVDGDQMETADQSASLSNWSAPVLPSSQPAWPNSQTSQDRMLLFNSSRTPSYSSPVPKSHEISVDHIRVGSALYAKPVKPSLTNMNIPEARDCRGLAMADAVTDPVREENSLSPTAKNLLPYGEPWFHGKISRQECETRLIHNGDFLVRESPTTSGQFVLSGRHDGNIKHLLLVDPDGRVRTKDQLFTSVSHLISYHLYNGLPIVTFDAELLLVFPVRRQDTTP